MPNARDNLPQIPKRILVLGDFGTGKSVFAASFPTPGFLFDLDSGVEIYRGKDWDYESYTTSPQSWVQLEKDINRVIKETNEGKYATIVIDSTTLMATISMERALQIDPKRSPSGGPLWNSHYSIVKNLMEGQLRKLLTLSEKAYVVVIGHIHLVMDNETGAVIAAEPLLPGSLSESFPGLFGEVYCAFHRKKDGKTEYYLRTAPKGLYKARSRVSGTEGLLPDEVPNNYTQIMELLTKAIAQREAKAR